VWVGARSPAAGLPDGACLGALAPGTSRTLPCRPGRRRAKGGRAEPALRPFHRNGTSAGGCRYSRATDRPRMAETRNPRTRILRLRAESASAPPRAGPAYVGAQRKRTPRGNRLLSRRWKDQSAIADGNLPIARMSLRALARNVSAERFRDDVQPGNLESSIYRLIEHSCE
jgi:hypothetical protein